MKNKIFTLSEDQQKQILSSIKQYMSDISDNIMKKSYYDHIDNLDFQNKLICGFAEINFLSQTLVLSIKKMFDYNIVYHEILDESKMDIFEVRELKLYLINNLINEKLPKKFIDENFNEGQLREYRKRMSEFKRDYIAYFESKEYERKHKK